MYKSNKTAVTFMYKINKKNGTFMYKSNKTDKPSDTTAIFKTR